ncbi:uncharacterized protein LOC115626581 [Scaptodrosophila lebanonensis]|uniref:Uncharacterized protein LOC115626581 n=1 Tax=Drosophila lebanonensis TaxID=7225 RepID=A0A6J2TSD1_DROLE|nr:uncharacterized protein LOC115626581 [Scaptodrosophila lebanonensis]
MSYGEAFFNILLIAACCYAMYSLTPADNPYGYVAAAFCFVHGFLDLLQAFAAEESDECSPILVLSASIIAAILLPLANIEFYLKSDMSGVALVHMMSFIPLLYDMLGKMCDDWDAATDTLNELVLTGNVLSISFLAVQTGNPMYGGIAAIAFFGRYGSELIDKFVDGLGPYISTLSNAAVIGLMTYSLTQG